MAAVTGVALSASLVSVVRFAMLEMRQLQRSYDVVHDLGCIEASSRQASQSLCIEVSTHVLCTVHGTFASYHGQLHHIHSALHCQTVFCCLLSTSPCCCPSPSTFISTHGRPRFNALHSLYSLRDHLYFIHGRVMCSLPCVYSPLTSVECLDVTQSGITKTSCTQCALPGCYLDGTQDMTPF